MTRNNDNNHYSKFENKITRIFDDFLNDVGFTRTHGNARFRGNGGPDGKPTWSPAIDIKENEREYLIIADVPGVRKEDLDVEFHDSVLVLSGYNTQDPSFNTGYNNTQDPSSLNAQEVNVGKDNQHQQSAEPQRYQQSSQPQQYQQQSSQPQQDQQSSQPQQYQQSPQQYQQQQPTEAQKFKQSVEPQHQDSQQNQQSQPQQYQQQPTGNQQPQYQQSEGQQNQQSSEPQQYQHVKHRQQRHQQGEKFHIQERPYGNFSRSIQLPNNINADDEFHASLDYGDRKSVV